MHTKLKIAVAFLMGTILSVAISISANDTGDTGRYQAAVTGLGKSMVVMVVVIDTQTGEIVRKEAIKKRDF